MINSQLRDVRGYSNQLRQNKSRYGINAYCDLKNAGYCIVDIHELNFDFCWADLPHMFNWCTENFGHEHWLFKWDKWMFFTRAEDAFTFKLRWS